MLARKKNAKLHIK